MSISSVTPYALLACFLWQFGGEAFAQTGQIKSQVESRTSEAETADETPWAVSPDKTEKKYMLVPVPIIDPTIGNGLALAGLYTFAPECNADAAPNERRSTIAVGAGYTNTDSWMVGGGLKLYLDEDRYRVKLATGYANMNLKWYGTSPDSPFFDNPIDFRTRGGMIDGNVEKRLTDHFFLGVSGRYIRPTASAEIPFPELPQPELTFNLTAVGAIADYDSRDNTWYPASGSLGVVNALAYLEALGSDREFGTLDATFAVYRKLAEPLVLAGEARVATVGDNTPFFMLSTVNLRGFPRGQYMNRTVTQVQAELRWEAWRRVGAAIPRIGGRQDECRPRRGDRQHQRFHRLFPRRRGVLDATGGRPPGHLQG
jgi:hypothetical protein